MVNLTATPMQGSIFSGWTGICSGMGTCSVTIDDMVAQTVEATFVNQNYSLDVSIIRSGIDTITSNPTGIDCSPTGDGTTCVSLLISNSDVTARFDSEDIFANGFE